MTIFGDPFSYPFPSRRTLVYAKNAMIAASQPLAAQAGLEILKQGGNAVDAAVACAAALTVVEPTGCGIGGDAFAIVWHNGKLYGLNASGPAPQSIRLDYMKSRGFDAMPKYGMIPVTVPGQPAGWAALSERFGKLPFYRLFQPAVDLACNGFPVSPTISRLWHRAECLYRSELKDEAEGWLSVFAPGGCAPAPGTLFSSKAHALSLERIGASQAQDFYSGDLANAIHEFSQKKNGFLTKSDLAGYKPEWEAPISVHYKGYDIWEMPPNTQGLIALMALAILKDDDFKKNDQVDRLHKQIEAMKLACADGLAYITQKELMPVDVDRLLAVSYSGKRRAMITDTARIPEKGIPNGGGTVYLACADGDGTMVSYIQSNFEGFGSGMVVPGTGIALQNRGHHFSLDPDHPNCLMPGKKTFHTIIPGFITKNDKPIGPFGVMGALMQPQAHLQVLMNMIDFGLNPQAALDAPRWQWMGGKTVSLESCVDDHIVKGLGARGHDIDLTGDSTGFGRGQIILRDPDTGVFCGGTEHRTDGHIAVW